MIGVVLWSSSDNQRALFWCEDHGDLAVFEAPSDAKDAIDGFDAGDLVQFDLRVERRKRFACNARRVIERAFDGLAESLMLRDDTQQGACNAGQVIPFPGMTSKQNLARA